MMIERTIKRGFKSGFILIFALLTLGIVVGHIFTNPAFLRHGFLTRKIVPERSGESEVPDTGDNSDDGWDESRVANILDQPVRFLSLDGTNTDPNLLREYKTNHRVRGSPSWNYMEKRRLGDDYRFCVKVAPFMGPFNYTSQSKNPCWYRRNPTTNTYKLHCVPYFYVAGVSKAGSTDVYERIVKHPDVHYDSDRKEKHYFDYKRYLGKGKDSVYFYTSHFQGFTAKVEEEIKTKQHSNLLTGDGTPCYFFYSFYWPCYEGNQGLTAPRYTNADVIKKLYPGTRIILSLRDPVSRLHSRFITIHRDNASAAAYHQSMRRSVDLYQACFRQWSPRHCAYNGTLYSLAGTRLQEGMYSVYLRDWLSVFPREQMFIYKFEDYVKDAQGYMDKIYKFLGLDPLPRNSTVAGRSNHVKKKEKPLRETIELLRKFYTPFNKDLAKLLGGDHWSWDYSTGHS